MKDYISITKKNAEKIMRLSLTDTALFMRLVMKADAETGMVDIEHATTGNQIPQTAIYKAINRIEKAGLIIQTGTAATIQNWPDFQL